MPRVPVEHTEARRQQILMAALRCFARTGLDRTTIRDICAEAGLSAGAVYNYFPAKQDIIEAVFDASLEENARMFEAFAGEEDPLAVLGAVRDVAFGSTDDAAQQDLARAGLAVIAEASRDPRLARRYAAVQRDMAERLGQLVARAQQRGALPPTVDPRQVGRMLLAVHEGWRIQKLMDPSLDTRDFLGALDFALGVEPD